MLVAIQTIIGPGMSTVLPVNMQSITHRVFLLAALCYSVLQAEVAGEPAIASVTVRLVHLCKNEMNVR